MGNKRIRDWVVPCLTEEACDFSRQQQQAGAVAGGFNSGKTRLFAAAAVAPRRQINTVV
jgi:hypothetical protein